MNNSNVQGFALLETASTGLGVFAVREFKDGERVLIFEGPLLHFSEISDFTHTIQVGEDLFLGASGGVDDFVNHSCDPNCYLRGERGTLELVAFRDIAKGEQLTFDYSTCLLLEPPLNACLCGTSTCRGSVDRYYDLKPSLRQRYEFMNAVPRFVLGNQPGSLGA